MATLTELKQQYNDLVENMRGVRFQGDPREWSEEVSTEWDQLSRKQIALEVEMRQQRDADAVLSEDPAETSQEPPEVRTAAPSGDWDPRLPEIRNAKTGERLEVCNRDVQSPLLDSRFSVANLIKARVLQSTDHFNSYEQRAPFDKTNPLTPEGWDRQWVEKLRVLLATVAAGAPIITINEKTLNLTRVLTLPTTTFWNELEAMTAAEGTTEGFTATPYRISNLQDASREFIADTPTGAAMLEQIAAQGMAEGIDSAAFNGNAKGPTGLLNEAGTQTLTAATGGSVSWAEISADIGTMLGANVTLDNLALVMNPVDMQALDAEVGTNGQWVGPSMWAERVNKIQSNSMPQGSYVMGDFQYCQVVYRTNSEFEWFLGGQSGVNLITQYAQALRVTSRVDVVYTRPDAFGVGSISA